MKLIKGSEHRAVIRMKVGEGTVTHDDGTSEKITIDVSNGYAPIIIYENGDMVIFSWDDILEMAEKVRNGEIEHE